LPTDRKLSRRIWLKGMALFSAVAILPSTAAKASKAAVHYQAYPKGKMRMCQTCKFFISAAGDLPGTMACLMRGGMVGHEKKQVGACQVVHGKISPMGYCDLCVLRLA
jgi:hypothetical protein